MIDQDKPVRVFRNWKHECYNIMQDGRVCASARQVRLQDVEFLVRESGRQRSLRLGKRNVHAYAIGRLVDFVHPDDERSMPESVGSPVFYDPRQHRTFMCRNTDTPVLSARTAQFDERGVTCEYHDSDLGLIDRAA